MKDATLKQAIKVLEMLRAKERSSEQLQKFLASGLLSDLLDVDIGQINRDVFCELLGYKKWPIWKALYERGVSDREFLNFLVDGSKLSTGKIADVLAGIIPGENIFQLAVDGNRTTEEMVEAGKYVWVHSQIDSENFPARPRPAGQRIIELIGFDYDPPYDPTYVVLAKAKKRGLERPVYEDALDFGEQFPEKQTKKLIVFLHEPLADLCGNNKEVMVLGNDSKGRYLSLRCFNDYWQRMKCLFAFVRPTAN